MQDTGAGPDAAARGSDTAPCPHLHRSKVAFKCYPLLVLASFCYPCLGVDGQLAYGLVCPAVATTGKHTLPACWHTSMLAHKPQKLCNRKQERQASFIAGPARLV